MNISKPKYPYAFVANTDVSSKPGEHWVHVCSATVVEYFDSLLNLLKNKKWLLGGIKPTIYEWRPSMLVNRHGKNHKSHDKVLQGVQRSILDLKIHYLSEEIGIFHAVCFINLLMSCSFLYKKFYWKSLKFRFFSAKTLKMNFLKIFQNCCRFWVPQYFFFRLSLNQLIFCTRGLLAMENSNPAEFFYFDLCRYPYRRSFT